jgi:His/Glu/Gln/Arg/opine family amino acid ABC transporter permease subunit
MMSIESLVSYMPLLLAGALRTLELVAYTLVLGFAFALPVALARNSASGTSRLLAHAFIFFFRGAPLLAVVFLLYYGIPQIPGIRDTPLWLLFKNPMPIAVLALSLNSAGFLAEILALALRNVPRGEIEAATAFGFTRRQSFLRFTAPNAARLGLRAYGNEVVFVVKGTAVVNFITIMDLVGAANRIYYNTLDPFTPLIAAGVIYLVIVLLIMWSIKWGERKLRPWLHYVERADQRR